MSNQQIIHQLEQLNQKMDTLLNLMQSSVAKEYAAHSKADTLKRFSEKQGLQLPDVPMEKDDDLWAIGFVTNPTKGVKSVGKGVSYEIAKATCDAYNKTALNRELPITYVPIKLNQST